MSSERLVARDLMTSPRERIGADRPLQEAIARLAAGAEGGAPPAIVVEDEEGRYAGLITARLLLAALFPEARPAPAVAGSPAADAARTEAELLDAIAVSTKERVRDRLDRALPTAAPGDRLLDLIAKACSRDVEWLPVVEEGRAIGLVPVTELLYRAALLALTPEDEGIRLDG
jgi:CBS domain-containing protein